MQRGITTSQTFRHPKYHLSTKTPNLAYLITPRQHSSATSAPPRPKTFTKTTTFPAPVPPPHAKREFHQLCMNRRKVRCKSLGSPKAQTPAIPTDLTLKQTNISRSATLTKTHHQPRNNHNLSYSKSNSQICYKTQPKSKSKHIIYMQNQRPTRKDSRKGEEEENDLAEGEGSVDLTRKVGR